MLKKCTLNKFFIKSKIKFLLLLLRSELVRECINENWLIRSNYWKSYHFKQINTSRNFDLINKIKLNVAIILFGPSLKKLYNFITKILFLIFQII